MALLDGENKEAIGRVALPYNLLREVNSLADNKSIGSTTEKLITSICIDGETLIHRQHNKHFLLTFISQGRRAITMHGQKAAVTFGNIYHRDFPLSCTSLQ